ncbi:MAG: ATP-binding protein [Candidatus Omnitrophica bacterium]|nr:ATP-binding protein [Candidatus Omnitrophota bacterium]MCM8770704.1 ATP-binding protein [Candidatus Omnitrophota bacterium]
MAYYEIVILGFVSLVFNVLLTLYVLIKISRIKELTKLVHNLNRSLEEMDEQAKLIVRTDIELNKAQTELDKKIAGLYTLQMLSRAITTTLEETKIFNMLEPKRLEEMGFEKALAFLWSEQEKKFVLSLNIGFEPATTQTILSRLDIDIFLRLIEEGKTISSFSIEEEALKESIDNIFGMKSYVIAPILPKHGNKGLLFVGTDSPDMVLTEGDEELITILANQLGQALENARLFEQTWRAQQELEEKVKQRTAELASALEQIKIISKRKSDFISAVSHELRTPLTSIKGFAAILLAEKLGALPPAVKERLEKINRHSDELVRMVNDLLDIARIESGKTVMKIEPQDLKSIIATVSDLIAVQCKNKNIELTQVVPQDLPLVLADKSQIERVFINLLGNAVKFTPQNGRITISARGKNGFVEVEVADTGIGIPEESLPSIFEEFYRVDNEINQQVKGSGLGLSLVKNIVEAHKGRISAKSKLNEGSTFSFTLPIAK